MIKLFYNIQIGLCDSFGLSLCFVVTIVLTRILPFFSKSIAVICLLPLHDIISMKKSIKNIDFFGNNKHVNRLDNKVKGKGKKVCKNFYY